MTKKIIEFASIRNERLKGYDFSFPHKKTESWISMII